jgi:acyl carrier protein
LVELVMQLEDSLDVTIPEDDLGDVRTVGDALDLIVAASAANA